MVCKKCGKVLPDGAKFCGWCGSSVEITDEEMTSKTISVSEKENQNRMKENLSIQMKEEGELMEPSAYSKVFIDPDEQLLGTLGNGYLENILYKKVRKCHALLTDKRVYFQGTFFNGNKKSLNKVKSEKILDLEDVTGTGFTYLASLNIVLIICVIILSGAFICGGIYFGPETQESWFLAWVCYGLAVVIPIAFVAYNIIKARQTFFHIEYAGGSISFNASIIGIADVKDFQRQIRRAKDYCKKANR